MSDMSPKQTKKQIDPKKQLVEDKGGTTKQQFVADKSGPPSKAAPVKQGDPGKQLKK